MSNKDCTVTCHDTTAGQNSLYIHGVISFTGWPRSPFSN